MLNHQLSRFQDPWNKPTESLGLSHIATLYTYNSLKPFIMFYLITTSYKDILFSLMYVFLYKNGESGKTTPRTLIELAKKENINGQQEKSETKLPKINSNFNCAVPKYCKNQHDCIP